MTADEAASYATLVGRLYPLVTKVAGAERIHVLSTMDGAPHFHVWLFPRRADDVKGRRFLANPGMCTEPEAAEAIEQMRALMG
jgi:hypothetical protein